MTPPPPPRPSPTPTPRPADPRARSGADAELERLTEQLTLVLARLLERHERLELLAGDYETALRRADGAGLASCVSAQNETIQEVAALDQERARVVHELGLRLGMVAPSRPGVIRRAQAPGASSPGDAERLRVTDLAERLPRELRERVLAVAGPLRASLERLGERHRVLRTATERVASHMDGLVRHVATAASHAKTYGRRGAVEGGSTVMTALDLRS